MGTMEVTNCFSSTPIPILAIKAGLPPLPLLIEHRQLMATLRLTFSPPEINPAAARLHKTVPNKFSFRSPPVAPDSAGQAQRRQTPPHVEDTLRNISKHLPIKEITHSVLPLLEVRSSLPLLNPHRVQTLIVPPLDPPPDSYTIVKKESRAILLCQWSSLAPPPLGYPWPPPCPHTPSWVFPNSWQAAFSR